MKIKKIYQSIVPNGKILNVKSSSQTDTYSCDYLNPKLLWTNPSPTSEFGAQTINVNLSDYDLIEIMFFNGTSNTRIYHSRTITGLGGSISNNETGYRFFETTNTSVSFGNCYQAASSGTITNGVLIPAYIIGYKTGLFN